MQETIICSAVHINDGMKYKSQPVNIVYGFVVCGRRHGDCYATIENIYYRETNQTDSPHTYQFTAAKDMGFITNTNRFVYRKEAMKIAKAANQLLQPQLHAHKDENDPLFILTSEDLFLDVE